MDYDRALTVKSLVNFMREPLGDKPWDEDENGQDVVHLSNGAVSTLSLEFSNGISAQIFIISLIFSKYHRL